MMLLGNILYTCSSGHPILYSELPVYDEPKKYNNNLKNKYIIESGDAVFAGNKIITKEINNIILNKDINLNSSKNIYTDIMPYNICECGLIFGFNKFTNLINYLSLFITRHGYIVLQKKYKNKRELIYADKNSISNNFNKENVYELNINYNFQSNEIKINVDGKEIFKFIDESLLNSKIGFFSSNNGTIFSQLIVR